ncbi:protein DYAD-like [Populus alba x Populus x berolinensis]|uniref:Protein DYAD-like n=1 Tax=Populus alba x Populus x berolinensis TaxID=444605 RepID=A0AAD6R3G3_9ROSI|nr:protein DYAD-like [Populus alba x Populus x berolinensis]
MCFLMSQSDKGSSELHESCGRGDESTKKGACLLEIKRTGMIQWGVSRHIEFVDSPGENNPQFPPAVVEHGQKNPQPRSAIVKHGQKNTQLPSAVVKHGKNNPQFPSAIVKEDLKVGEDGIGSFVLPEAKKRKCHALSEHREGQAVRRAKAKKTSLVYKSKQIKRENSISIKKENVKDRWSVDRYNLAEKSMLDVMKAEGAVFENPISRSALRTVARKHIGDTGLLDHLLKHIDGKVAPGGTERFRRCYNTQGIMEYWLESADLVKIKQEAGVPDPNYVPPSWYRPGSVSQDSVSAKELTLLRDEVAKMKRDMEELVSKNQEQHQANQIGDIYKEFVEWRGKIDQHLMGISSSLGGLQSMYKDVMTWKSKTEQQLKEISNSLSSMQASKQCTALNPISERWEDWLESTNLDNIQGEDFAPWLENTDLVNFKQNASPQEQEPYNAIQPWLKHSDNPSQEPVCAGELELLKEEMAKMKRDVQELVPKRMEEDQANMTPDSSATANSKSELDNSFSFFQEMFKELGNWRVKMEQQMLEISNAVNTLQASKQCIT